MGTAVNDWLVYCRRNYSSYTVEQYRHVLIDFLDFIGSDKPITAITMADIERYIDHIIGTLSPNTVNARLIALKSFWSWGAKRGGFDNIAADIPFLTTEPPDQRVLTEEEYAAVLEVCSRTERDVIEFYAHTGLRRGEFLRLKPDDIASDMMTLQVRRGKGRKSRTIPLNAVCRAILARDHELRFQLRYGTPSAQFRLCHRLAIRAGIAAFGPHALRHLFCTRMFRAGVAPKVISMILGHSSLLITEQVYCHLLPVDLIGTTESLAM